MKATLTELHKRPGEVLRAVKSGQAVTLTEHGVAVATITPLPTGKFDGKRLAAALHRLGEEDPEGCQEMARILIENRGNHR